MSLNSTVPLADLGGGRARRAPPHLPGILVFETYFFQFHALFTWKQDVRPPICDKTAPPHLPGILVFDDILGHIV